MNPIRLRGPADVLAVLPFQLGYHPHEAVVVVAVSHRSIGLVQRLDLPPADDVDAAVGALLPALERERPEAVLLVGYESARSSAVPVLDALRDACVHRGMDVLDRLLVRDGRWYAVDCATGCCPKDGAALPAPEDTPAVADFVAMETAPLSDREAVRRQLDPDPVRSAEVAAAIRQAGPQTTWRVTGSTLGRAPAGAAFGLARDDVPDPPTGAAALPAPPWVPPYLRVVGGHRRTEPPAEVLDGDLEREAERAAEATAAERARDARRLRQLSGWAVVCDVSAARPPLDGLAPEEVADLALSLRDVHLRDGLIAWFCPGTLPLDVLDGDLADQLSTCLPAASWAGVGRSRSRSRAVAARRLQARLVELCRMLPDEEAAPALTVLAQVAWCVLGDGALARAAVERALGLEPDYRLAQLVATMVDVAFRPTVTA
jgi:hypothetical protein